MGSNNPGFCFNTYPGKGIVVLPGFQLSISVTYYQWIPRWEEAILFSLEDWVGHGRVQVTRWPQVIAKSGQCPPPMRTAHVGDCCH
eukprot:scaffold9294_cov232-Skeletonema_dohrnii-CCMP3373.AAC.7